MSDTIIYKQLHLVTADTHHESIMFKDIHFAHRASSMVEKPRVDAHRVKLVPVAMMKLTSLYKMDHISSLLARQYS